MLLFTFILCGFTFCILDLVASSGSGGWSYKGDGPSKWKDSYADCGSNSNPRQSPIDVNKNRMVFDKLLTPLTLNNYNNVQAGKFTVSNNGHSVKVDGMTSMTTSGGHLPQIYRLAQFHVHFGSASTGGSEHTLFGRRFPGEMHLVHVNSKYNNDIGVAVTKPDGLLVLGFFLDATAHADNTAFGGIIGALKSIEYKDTTTEIPAFKVGDLLPSTTNRKKFYHYLGGLTTPGCFGVVSWYVYDTPISLSRTQMNKFNTLLEGKVGESKHAIKDNFRPVQPIGNRMVTSSFRVKGIPVLGESPDSGSGSGSDSGSGSGSGSGSIRFRVMNIIVAVSMAILQF